MSVQRILITGCKGLIGRILWEHLADSFELYGLDLVPAQADKNIFQADIARPDQIKTVFEQIPSLTYIIHLAGDPRMDADWESVYLNNIGGTKNIYEAARFMVLNASFSQVPTMSPALMRAFLQVCILGRDPKSDNDQGPDPPGWILWRLQGGGRSDRQNVL